MSMIDAIPLLAGAGADGGYQISRSVRLRSSASAYFNRTPASAGNRKTWTWSGWVKLGSLSTTLNLMYAYSADSDSGLCQLSFQSNQLRIQGFSASFLMVSTPIYRDPSAWYHIVYKVDTTQATAADRVRVYVNGVQITAWATNTPPPQNTDTAVNNNVAHNIGRNTRNSNDYLDGYLTEINLIDGQALTPSSFGETNAVTGVWQPKRYAGTYGTNGFYLNFSDNSGVTATTIGKDYSGNGNNWTPNNISVTAGVTYDSMLDVPTLYADGGNGRGNYATWNPLSRTACTITNGNLQAVGDGGNYDNIPASIAFDGGGSDGFYWEFTSISNNTSTVIGICSINNSELNQANPTFSFANSVDGWGYLGNGDKVNSGTTSAYGNSWTNNDVIGVAVKNGKIWFSKNGTFQASGDPAAGTNQAFSSISGLVYPVAGINGTNGFIVNFGQRPFSYTPPTGFKALNTQNLPAPTISKGNQYMDVVLYTGNAVQDRAITGFGFDLDLAWIKSRNNAGSHVLVNSVVGGDKQLFSNLTNAEQTNSDMTNGFTTGGILVGDNITGTGSTNQNTYTYALWGWNAGGSTVTNTSGTISSQVRANTTAGFSVVTFTSTGSSGAVTVGHGLGVAPAMVITKERGAVGSWGVYHTGLTTPASQYLNLQTTGAATTNTSYWGNTNPTSTVVTLGNGTMMALNTTMVMYCFAAVSGYSAFGSYTGNGSADGPFVYLGFRPRFLMIKNTTNAQPWIIVDTSRNTYNQAGDYLQPNSSAAENGGSAVSTATADDILSNGFKLRNNASSSGYTNANGNTYIYMAFSEVGFKYALGR